MSFNRTGRILLPKRWSRAKRKLRRAGIQWLRRIEPAYRRMLESIWGDQPGLDWSYVPGAHETAQAGRFIDTGESMGLRELP